MKKEEEWKFSLKFSVAFHLKERDRIMLTFYALQGDFFVCSKLSNS